MQFSTTWFPKLNKVQKIQSKKKCTLTPYTSILPSPSICLSFSLSPSSLLKQMAIYAEHNQDYSALGRAGPPHRSEAQSQS